MAFEAVLPASGTPTENSDGPYTVGQVVAVHAATTSPGVRWYKPPSLSTTVTLGLWDEAGTLVVSKAVAVSGAAAWRDDTWDSPIDLTPQMYTVGYLTPSYYSMIAAQNNDLVSQPVKASPNGLSTYPAAGGRYTSGGSLARPASSPASPTAGYAVDLLVDTPAGWTKPPLLYDGLSTGHFDDTGGLTIGTRFTPSTDLSVAGVTFGYYQASTTVGLKAALRASDGTVLASKTVTVPAARGIYTVLFDTPVDVTSGTEYKATVWNPDAKYSSTSAVFGSTVTGPVYTMPAAAGQYNDAGDLNPTSVFNNAFYHVVPALAGTAVDTTKPTISTRSPGVDATNVAVDTTIQVTFTESVTGPVFTVVDSAASSVPGTLSGSGATRTWTPDGDLANSETFTVTVTAAEDAAGNTMDPDSWDFTTMAPLGTGGGETFGATIAAENALSGDPAAEWQVTGWGDPDVQGFARVFSTLVGNRVNFSVHGPCATVDIYRLGYYGGDGARLVVTVANSPTTQPTPGTVTGAGGSGTGARDAANWSTTAAWDIPADALSGVYLAVPRNSGAATWSHIPFVVRQDARAADIAVKTSDTTWHAYNHFGGNGANLGGGADLYGSGGAFSAPNRSRAVSYNRAITHRQIRAQTALFNAEYPLIRWMERNGLDVKYIGCYDLDQGVGYSNTQILVSSGHDEYWSEPMRDNAVAFRDAGKHLVFMSGNEVFWRVYFADAGRTVWCAKDSLEGGVQQLGQWTGTWKDTRWGGREPENTLTGTDFRMNGILDLDATVVAATYGASPFWRDTTVETGTNLTLTDVVGFEADTTAPTAVFKARARLAATSHNIDGFRADDNGATYDGSGTLDWGPVLQRWASGGWSVGFGTVQWAWALDPTHDRQAVAANREAQQATLNLFADMGAAPATPQGDLTAPTPVPLITYLPGGDFTRWDGDSEEALVLDGYWDGTRIVPLIYDQAWDGGEGVVYGGGGYGDGPYGG